MRSDERNNADPGVGVDGECSALRCAPTPSAYPMLRDMMMVMMAARDAVHETSIARVGRRVKGDGRRVTRDK
jgi:hypothetical protein